jgi:polar amino acid transport system ATP-binding protein/putative ABC transport system ATP-binding protein
LDKKILLLDEPTSALDPLSRDKLTTFLKSLENTTIVAITHDIGFAGQLDRIINLKKN